MDMTSEGRTGFPTTSFSFFQVWLFGAQMVNSHVTQNQPGSTSSVVAGVPLRRFLKKNRVWMKARRWSRSCITHCPALVPVQTGEDSCDQIWAPLTQPAAVQRRQDMCMQCFPVPSALHSAFRKLDLLETSGCLLLVANLGEVYS